MALDFPSSPTVGQLYPNPAVAGVPQYTWDGEKWASGNVASIATSKKNYIINGAMMVSQENGGTSGTATGYYPVDMFNMAYSNAGTQTTAQVASMTPGGSPNRLRVTATAADASVGAGDYCFLRYAIEGLRTVDLRIGTASAKTITIQFGVKAPAGTYCVALQNLAGNRTYVAEYVIAAGEANTDVVKSVVVTLDTTGTWPVDNTLGLLVLWTLMAGSTFQQTAGSWQAAGVIGSSNQFNFMGTNGNVFELFDVGLYEGNVAPPFMVPDYVSELAACQRYWQKTYQYGDVLGTIGYSGAVVGIGTNTVNRPMLTVNLAVTMRTAPSIVFYSPGTGAVGKCADGNSSSDMNATLYGASAARITIYAAATPGSGSQVGFHFISNARL